MQKKLESPTQREQLHACKKMETMAVEERKCLGWDKLMLKTSSGIKRAQKVHLRE